MKKEKKRKPPVKLKKKERKSLSRDIDEGLLQPIEIAVKDFWRLAWQKPKAEDYKLLGYINFSLIGETFINYMYNIREGEFGI